MKCTRCKLREEVLEFAESILDYNHGFTQKTCRQCYIKIIEEKLKDINKNLKIQKDLLIKEKSK